MEEKTQVYKERTFGITLSVALFHLLYFLSLVNSDIFRPQYILLYLTVVAVVFFKEVIKNLQYIVFFGFLLIWSSVCIILNESDFEVFYNVLYFFSLFIIVQFYTQYQIGLRLHWFLIISYFVFILYNLFQGVDPNFILDKRSQNMVGFYMLCYVIIYYIEDYKNNVSKLSKYQINVIPALLNLFVALSMFGRSSIVIAIMLLLFILFQNFKHNKLGKNIIYFLIIVSFIYFLYIQLQASIDLLLQASFSRFSKEGADLTGREEIWNRYMYHFDRNYIYSFFGVPLNADIEFIYHDRNLHNSYLTLHSYTGIGSLVVLWFVLKRFFVKGKFFLKTLLVVLLLRAFSDSIFFISFNDYVLFSLIFIILPLKVKKII